MSSFLLYICERALTGRDDEINEISIGADLFNRPNYDPASDGLVRSHASRLRQRLEQYFSEDGAQEPIRLIIPKGGYIPRFQTQVPTLEPSESATPESVWLPSEAALSDQKSSPDRAAIPVSTWILAAALLLACGVIAYLLPLAHRAHTNSLSRSEAHPFWRLFFGSGQNTTVVCSDTSLATLEDVTRQRVSLSDYLNDTYRMHIAPPQGTTPDLIRDLGTRRYTAIADVGILTRFYQLAGSNSDRLQFRYARDLRPNDLKEGSMILIGSTYSNPWVEIFDTNMNFTFQDNSSQQISSIINRSPRPGERHQYDFNKLDASQTIYGVVALRPNLRGSGKVLLLEGTSMAGTEAAADFVFDDAHLLPFLAKIRNQDGSIPYFEVLLQSSNMDGSASRLAILAYRTAQN
ncbi:hypothetical protein [Edaphobacter sp. HDX4]|uniref:hypothetical protein n=1 Tax=Edaphobacter sp. HDX4 TaxID=2794064 RepID=UPI002FE6A60B